MQPVMTGSADLPQTIFAVLMVDGRSTTILIAENNRTLRRKNLMKKDYNG